MDIALIAGQRAAARGHISKTGRARHNRPVPPGVYGFVGTDADNLFVAVLHRRILRRFPVERNWRLNHHELFKAIMKFFTVKVLLWPTLLIIAMIVAGTGVVFASGGLNALALGSLFGSSSTERDSKVVQAVTRVQEVALLSLHIQGIDRKESNGEIFGVAVPASEKTTLVQYTVDAKLGIDGSKVKIEPNGPESFRVTIPKFIGIGFDDPVFEDPLESGGALSWFTPPAVQTRMINNILSNENKQHFITQNEVALKDQATAFYSGIISSIDPEVTVEFEFAE